MQNMIHHVTLSLLSTVLAYDFLHVTLHGSPSLSLCICSSVLSGSLL